MKSEHGVARDWPLQYTDIEPYYCQAEHEIGVSANVDEQGYLGITFPEGYDYQCTGTAQLFGSLSGLKG